MVRAVAMFRSWTLALEKTSAGAIRSFCSCRNRIVTGISTATTAADAPAVQAKAMLARNPDSGPTKIEQDCCTNCLIAVSRPEPETACAVSTM